MGEEIQLKPALHNTIYQCRKDQKIYSAHKKTPFLVTELAGFKPGVPEIAGAGGKIEIIEAGSLLCEDCFMDLGLAEKPSPIFKANPAITKAIKEGSIHGKFQ